MDRAVSRRLPGTRRLSMSTREAIAGFLFIGPWLIGFIGLTLGPMIASLFLSLTDYSMVAPPQWVGIKNYLTIFTDDPAFSDSVRVTLTYATFAVPVGVALTLAIAILMNQKVPGVTVWRTIYYLPSVVAGVAVSMLWVWVFQTDFGLINTALAFVGIQGPAWLNDPDWALVALILMSYWSIGSGMIVNLAGLQGIPTELYEAASIDGANWWHRFRAVTLPMLSPVLFFNVVIGAIDAFQYFTNAFVMTQGGPGRSTLFYNLYLYINAFRYFKMGYAAALAWILFMLILVVTLLIFRSTPFWVHYEGKTGGR